MIKIDKKAIKNLISDFTSEEHKRIKKILDAELKDSDVIKNIKKKIDKVWFFIITTSIVIIVTTILMFIFKVSLVIIFVWFIIAIPLSLGVGVVFIIKLVKDKDKIINKIIPVISRQALRIMIFANNKKLHDHFIIYTKSDFNFNNGTYLIDEKCIYDYNGYPTIFYKENIPNPLLFDFMAEINFFNSRPELERKNPNGIIGITGHKLILTYSSDTLIELLKKKFFLEFLKGKHDDLFKIIAFGLIILALVIVISVIFKKPDTIQVVSAGVQASGGLPK